MEDSDGRQSGNHDRDPRQAPNDRGGVAELLARVEAAMGPDRELDRDLAEWAYPDLLTRERRSVGGEAFSWMHPRYGLTRCEPYTASLDAALALVERCLPGRSWDLSFTLGDQPYYMANLLWPAREFRAVARTPALALLAALLRALSIHPDAKSAPVVGEGDMASVLRPFASDRSCQSRRWLDYRIAASCADRELGPGAWCQTWQYDMGGTPCLNETYRCSAPIGWASTDQLRARRQLQRPEPRLSYAFTPKRWLSAGRSPLRPCATLCARAPCAPFVSGGKSASGPTT
jgi:hypothetical protein